MAHYENMSTVAKILNNSQPYVSKQISSLEQELGHTLFDRAGRGVRLNEHGKRFLRYATDAYNTLNDGLQAIQEVSQSSLGTIHFGVMALAQIIHPAVREFAIQNRDVNFRYTQINPNDRNTIRSIDILISPSEQNQYNLSSIFPVSRALLQEKYYLVGNDFWLPFPEDTPEVSLTDCRHIPFIIIGRPSSDSLISDYSVLETAARTADIPFPRIAYSVNDFAFKLQLVGDNAGISVLPESCLSLARRIVPGLKMFPIKEYPQKRVVVVARQRRANMSPIASVFWDHLLNFYRLQPDSAN